MAFEIPEEETKETGSVLTFETKKKNSGSQRGSTVWRRHCGAEEEESRRRGDTHNLAESVHAPRVIKALCGRSINADRKAEVWRRLETVTDPELDEPVTALEFVTRADVDR